jgi:predicted O-methyltransferase YrrM
MSEYPEHSPNIDVGWYSEANFSPPRPLCPTPAHWNTVDIQATEAEVIDMVAGLIRGHQPDIVLETGTSRGYLTLTVSAALEANRHGTIHTYEPDKQTMAEATALWQANPEISGRIVAHEAESMAAPWTGPPIDFAWHDSLTDLRQPEFDFFLPHYSDRAVVCFHDTAPRFGVWSNRLRARLFDAGFSYLDWPSPRGVIIATRNG